MDGCITVDRYHIMLFSSYNILCLTGEYSFCSFCSGQTVKGKAQLNYVEHLLFGITNNEACLTCGSFSFLPFNPTCLWTVQLSYHLHFKPTTLRFSVTTFI